MHYITTTLIIILEQESNVPNALSGGGSGHVSPDLFFPNDTRHPVSNTARAAQSTSSVQVSPELFSDEEVFTFSTHEGPPEHGRDGSREWTATVSTSAV